MFRIAFSVPLREGGKLPPLERFDSACPVAPSAGAASLGALRGSFPGALRSRRARFTAALVGAVCATAAVALVSAVARTSGAGPTALASGADDLDYKYLAAEASGDTSMLQKLQVIDARTLARSIASKQSHPHPHPHPHPYPPRKHGSVSFGLYSFPPRTQLDAAVADADGS